MTVNCSYNSPVLLQKVFTKNENNTIDSLISFYDDFIFKKTGIENIKDSYDEYLSRTMPKVVDNNNLGLLMPNYKSIDSLFSTLDSNSLKEIYTISNFKTEFNDSDMSFITVRKPYILSLNIDGKFMLLLEELASENDWYYEFYDGILSENSFSPASYAQIFFKYSDINFSNKAERLVFIVSILSQKDN